MTDLKTRLEDMVADKTFNHFDNKLTHCVITLKNGFKITGESFCVDPANFSKELGEKYSYERAFASLLDYDGYLRQAVSMVSKDVTNDMLNTIDGEATVSQTEAFEMGRMAALLQLLDGEPDGDKYQFVK